jgi:hypothetical protein
MWSARILLFCAGEVVRCVLLLALLESGAEPDVMLLIAVNMLRGRQC